MPFLLAPLLGVLTWGLIPGAAAEAAPVSGGVLVSGQPVNGVVSAQDGISYTFTAVTGHHVTLSVTNPKTTTTPGGNSLVLDVYDAAGANVGTPITSCSDNIHGDDFSLPILAHPIPTGVPSPGQRDKS